MYQQRLDQRGFTLIEALVAITILAFVLVGFLGLRTASMVDAVDARALRIAREFAHAKLSELQAGAIEIEPVSGDEQPIEDYPEFSYAVFIGEGAVGEAEERIAAPDADSVDRREWQQERADLRRAEQAGLSLIDYRDQQFRDDNEIKPPSEYEIEEIAVAVYYPVRNTANEAGRSVFVLKAQVSTAALRGLTPDRAESLADQLNGDETFSTTPTHRHPNAASSVDEQVAENGQ